VFKRTFLLLLIALSEAMAQSLVTSDIQNFWKAYDAGRTGDRSAAFQKLYFDAGSPALKEFLNLRVGSAESLAYAVDQRFPKFYAAARPYTYEVEKQRENILRYLARFRELYPPAEFPPVTFAIGTFSNKETIGTNGIVIDVAAFSKSADADSAELKKKLITWVAEPERLPLMVVHAIAHAQCAADLGQAVPSQVAEFVREGAADFIVELVTGINPNAHTDAWALPNHLKLFQDLAKNLEVESEMDGEAGPWSENNNGLPSPIRMVYANPTAGDEPATLGNWMGKQICASYYARSNDKAAALRDIVTLQNIAGIVRGSEYAWLAPAQ
jgi:hypothetical protein